VLCDFNAILNREEMRWIFLGDQYNLNLEIVDFNVFVRNMENIDLPILGRKFTWFHVNGSLMSRIDRVMIIE
jgi:hypothetical protein